MDTFRGSVAVGPAAVPVWILVAITVGIVCRVALPPVLRRVGLSAETERVLDTIFTATIVALVLWKLYPVVDLFPEIRDNPSLLLRAPGGRRGVVAGLIGATLYTAWRVWRVEKRRNAMAAIGVAGVVAAAAAIAVVVVVAAVGSGHSSSDRAVAPGDDVALELLDGTSISLATLQGKPTVLTFWATWCGPCAAELPYKKSLHAAYAEGANFVGVNVTRTERSVSDVADYVRDNGIEYAVALDRSGTISDRFFVRGTPTTVVLDASGEVVARWAGPVHSDRIVPYLR